MPDSDLILNVRQIAGYPNLGVQPTDNVLLQRGGLGGPYLSVLAEQFVGQALLGGGTLSVGNQPPGDADGGQIFTDEICTPIDGTWLWNGYVAGGQIKSVNAGPVAVVNVDVTKGWQYVWSPAVPPGTPWTPTEAVTISPTGYISGGEQILLARDPAGPLEAATAQWVDGVIAGVRASSVWSFMGRTGDVRLWIQDIIAAGGAPIYSPMFMGSPMAFTPSLRSNSNRLATTAFVHMANGNAINCLLQSHPFVFTFNGRSGDVVLTADDIIAAGGSGEIFNSPNFTGVPTAPTATAGTNTNQIATTAFVQQAITTLPYAPLASPVFTGNPQGPTAAPGSSTGQLATTAFVMNAVAASTAGVASFNTRTGAVDLEAGDITGAGGALLASPTFTGVPAAPTAAPGSNSTQLATTAFVQAAVTAIGGGVTSFNTRTGAIVLTSADLSAAGGALLASPALTGTPTAPTAAFGNSSQQIATTAFVDAAILNGAVESFNGRTGSVTLTSADISAAGGAALQSPAFLGTPTAPTAAPGANSTQLATTAFVQAAISVGAGVTSFNTRTGAVSLTIGDVTGVGGAPLTSPAFTGVPTAPTAAVGTSSTQLATTAFVAAALAGGAGVSSFNTRTGAITLLGSDVTAAGGALLSSPAFTGTPTAPTQTSGNSSTALATTAFVQSAIAAGSVASFNGRVGAITLNSADISAAGGALTASPALTGVPTAPTATAGTNTNQIATTQFVESALAAAGGVNSFNGRAGTVTLTGADITGAGGAVLASPAFTGSPTAPTAAPGTSTTQLATTAFVASALSGYLLLTGGALSGGLSIGGSNALVLSGAAGTYRALYGATNNVNRWQLSMADGTAESGSNAGSNWRLDALADNGTTNIFGGPVLSFVRSTGAATFVGTITAPVYYTGGNIYVNSNGMSWQGGPAQAMTYNSANVTMTGYSAGTSYGAILISNGLGSYSPLYNIVLAGSSSVVLGYYNGTAQWVQWPVTFSSDRRLKRNLHLSDRDALSAIMSVPIYECDMTQPLPGATEQHWNWSVVADELDKAIPLAVTPPVAEGGYEAIRELPIVVCLMKAMQQLLTRVETLEARLA